MNYFTYLKKEADNKGVRLPSFMKDKNYLNQKIVKKYFSKNSLNDFSVDIDYRFLINSAIDTLNDIDLPIYGRVFLQLKDNVSRGLKLIKNIVLDGKILFKRGTNLKLVINYLSRKTARDNDNRYLAILNLLSSINNFKYRIVFTTNPWDIATMSMRGIDSCMKWSSTESLSLVGSILCPAAGIIYLTDGSKTKHGEKMLARSIVRLVKKTSNKKQNYIFVDQSYSFLDKNLIKYCHEYDYRNQYLEDECGLIDCMFKNVLKNKIKNNKNFSKFIVKDGYGIIRYHVPLSKTVRSLGKEYLSYFDSEYLEYK